MPDAIMLFAAGFGTRMGALTQSRPKPLIEVSGRPLLQHALDIAQNVPRKVVNSHYKADQIADFLSDQPVMVSEEQPDILDTGGGLRQALPLLNSDPVYALNTDAVWYGPNPLEILEAVWEPEKMEALLLCVPLKSAVGRKGGGDFALEDSGQLRRGGDLVYTGAQILKTDRLAEIEETAFSLNMVWNAMNQAGTLYGATYPGTWCDVGYPEAIALAEDAAHV